MKENLMESYRIIGRIQNAISKAETLDEALRTGLQIILESCGADHAVMWYQNKEGDGSLHPYYWICPVDFTSLVYKPGEEIVGNVYETQTAARLLDFAASPDADTQRQFKGIEISSYICVPVSSHEEKIGCIQLVKESGMFTEDEADICEILTMMAAIQIDENEKLHPWETRNVILNVKDVIREFKNGDTVTRILKGVNLDVYDGEFLVLLGESGCGKSTLLNIISGMDKADGGTLTYMGKDYTDASQEELTKFRRDNIGFIFQSYNLMPNLNARENLNLIGELVDDPMSAEEALDLVGLKDRQTNYPSQLSGGQQQRVSIARALMKKPKLIFADEPTAALDYTTSIEVLSAMEKIVKSGTTLVMVTHNEEITRMADRVVRMRNGKTYEIVINRHPVHAEDLVW